MKIHYIVAFYLGDRGTASVNNLLIADRYYLIKKHLSALKSLELPAITKITFVVSHYNTEIDNYVPKIIEEEAGDLKIDLRFRKNEGYSYAAWNDVINEDLSNNVETDYYFLFEDDYVPNIDYFYQPYVDEVTSDKIGYVCQRYIENHASASIGLLSYEAALKNFNKNGSVFDILSNDESYSGAIDNQVHYLDSIKKLGYLCVDVCKTCFQIFLDRKHFVFYGQRKGLVPIVPISTLDWKLHLRDNTVAKFRLLSEVEDWEETYNRCNNIRGTRAKSFSKNPNVFTAEESIKYFKENAKNIWIIYDTDKPDYIISYVKIGKNKKENTFQFHVVKPWKYANYSNVIFNFFQWYIKEYDEKTFISKVSTNNDYLIDILTRFGFTNEITINNILTMKYVHTQE